MKTFSSICALSENGKVGKRVVFLTVCRVVASVINAKSETRLGCKDQIIVVYFLVLISFSSSPRLNESPQIRLFSVVMSSSLTLQNIYD